MSRAEKALGSAVRGLVPPLLRAARARYVAGHVLCAFSACLGKSTLLNLLSGKLEPTSGEVTRHRHLRIGRYDQHFHELLPENKSPCEYLRSEFDIPEQQARKARGRSEQGRRSSGSVGRWVRLAGRLQVVEALRSSWFDVL